MLRSVVTAVWPFRTREIVARATPMCSASRVAVMSPRNSLRVRRGWSGLYIVVTFYPVSGNDCNSRGLLLIVGIGRLHGSEKQIHGGNDRQKSKGKFKNRAGFCGIPPLPQRARQGWGTLVRYRSRERQIKRWAPGEADPSLCSG